MKELFRKKRLFFILLLPLGAFLFYTAPNASGFIEKFYSNGFFKLFTQILSRISGVIPFSIAEFGLIAIVIAAIFYIAYVLYRIIRQKRNKHHVAIQFVINAAVITSIVYFALVILWSLNYSRLPFAKIANLDVRPSSVSELSEVCRDIIERANELRPKVTEDSKGVMVLKDGYREAFRRAYKGYDNTAKLFPELGGKYGNPKGVTFSYLMSYTGLSGVYCPFTAEANVDIDMPDAFVPGTACHEMAHQRGFAREDEANYIAYLTCINHPDYDFKYSGALLALIHSTNALYSYDKDEFFKLRKLYSQGIVRDLRDNNEYWQRFEGPVERAADSINNAYLKANMQKDGVRSYGRMVDLLIAEYRAKKAR